MRFRCLVGRVLFSIGVVTFLLIPVATGESFAAPAGQTQYVPAFWYVTPTGGIAGASSYGSPSGTRLARPVVGIVSTSDHKGYWMVAADGGVFSYGDAAFYGSLPSEHVTPAEPVVGMAATPTDNGYWLFAADGGVFAFGGAKFLGSAAGLHLAAPIVGGASTSTGDGYWLVGSDGGVFAYGDATFHGSAAALRLAKPVSGVTPTADDGGYWLAAADGGVFAYGDARFFGSAASQSSYTIVGSPISSPDGDGYWLPEAEYPTACFAYGDVYPTSSSGAPPREGECVTSTSTPPATNISRSYVAAANAGFS